MIHRRLTPDVVKVLRNVFEDPRVPENENIQVSSCHNELNIRAANPLQLYKFGLRAHHVLLCYGLVDKVSLIKF